MITDLQKYFTAICPLFYNKERERVYLHTSHCPCGVLVVGIGSYARSGIGEVVDLLAAVHYISRGAAIWNPPKSVKRPFNVVHTLYS